MAHSCTILLCLIVFALLFIAANSQRTKNAASVRQCSCHEQSQCIRDLKKLGERCVDQCWFHTKKITQKPQQLRQCFEGKDHLVDGFVNCFQRNFKSCVASRHGPLIPRQSISGITRAAEKKIHSLTQSILASGLGGNMDRLISTAESLGECAKRCFNAKTSGGVCLRKYKCQPLLPREEKAGQLFSKCMKIDFKKEGRPLCNCALNAGVRELSSICTILSLMGSKG